MPAPLRAADEATESIEAITVTGIRASIESAISVKRESADIVEAISSEDIGKLPDPSIAKSLTRLPGITAQRSDGRTSSEPHLERRVHAGRGDARLHERGLRHE